MFLFWIWSICSSSFFVFIEVGQVSFVVGQVIFKFQPVLGQVSEKSICQLAPGAYIDIVKFVILYNEFVLHKENKSGMMNRCWTLYIHKCKQNVQVI